MAINRLADLEIGHAYAPSLSKSIINLDLISNDPSPATVVLVGLLVLAVYSIVWNIMLRR